MSAIFFCGRRCVVLAIVLACTLLPAAAFGGAGPPVQRQVLPNGMVLIVSEEHTLPFVTLRYLSDAGAWRDPAALAGLANLTAEGLLLGTPSLTAHQINERVDLLGAALSATCSFDYAALDFKVLKKNWAPGSDLFVDAITRPTFPEEEIRRKVRAIQSALNEEEDQPGVVAEKAFQRALFRYSPYGHAVEGTIESLEAVSPEQVRDFYHRRYRPQTSILVIVGDVSSSDIQSLADRLSQWEGSAAAEEAPQQVFAPSARDVHIDQPVAQANIVLGHAGIARANPDFHAVTVMNEILGGGFTSRLLRHIRVEKGLAYAVSSYFEARKYPGAFQIVLQTKNASAQEAIRIAREEMRRMRQAPVSDQELNTAKNYLIGSFPLRYASQNGLAQLLAYIEYYRLGPDYFAEYAGRIRRIEKKDVQDAARKYLQPDKAIVAIVADLQAAGMK
ncbi:MAG: insulinase family protein [Desulfobacteraceae bacterium]|nr:MAG: insulinase family protein [Desulfobacteraceae bacterium]